MKPLAVPERVLTLEWLVCFRASASRDDTGISDGCRYASYQSPATAQAIVASERRP
ncbi:MAG: hypothetical protein QOJ23_4546 [Actinomycetota bacterium]|nr:hypothetical protein [Actinomycetota bacterium]